MLYALINDIKSCAIPNTTGECPFCNREVISKCGEFKMWHWAHKRSGDCDSWYKPETDWHRQWKQIFGKANCEVIVEKDGSRHIADIKTKKGSVIELQNSPIDYETLVARENFYGNDMIWIINGIPFYDKFSIKSKNNQEYDIPSQDFERFAKMYGFSTEYAPEEGEKVEEKFYWKRAREVWSLAEAQVYMDSGDEFLFEIMKWTGRSKGIGCRISKRQFILDNDGDVSLLSSILLIQ